jgi:hypothetical protein
MEKHAMRRLINDTKELSREEYCLKCPERLENYTVFA